MKCSDSNDLFTAEQQAAILHLYVEQHRPCTKVARQLAVIPRHVRKFLRQRGVLRRHRGRAGKLSPDQRQQLETELSTVPDSVLGQRYGVTRERIRQIREDLGLPSSRVLRHEASLRAQAERQERERARREQARQLREQQRKQREAARQRRLEAKRGGPNAGHLRELRWQERLAALTAFLREHGPVGIPSREPQFRRLAQWLHHQRRCFQRGRLSAGRVAQLDATGFAWRFPPSGRATWRAGRMLALLVEFYRERGAQTIPGNDPHYAPLAHWIHHERHEFRRGRLPAPRVARLDATGYPWHEPLSGSYRHGASNQQPSHFYAQFEAFVAQHGHDRVPRNSPDTLPLAQWLSTQRYLWRIGKLSAARIARLEKLGISSRPPNPLKVDLEARWEARVAGLADFIRRHGHCTVHKHDPQAALLYRWIVAARSAYRHGFLRAERIRQLEALGFVWNSGGQSRWDERFRQLAEFHRAHGHWRVPSAQPQYLNLYGWLRGQQKLCAAGTLRPERLQRLAALNVPWALNAVTPPAKETQG